VPLHRTLLQLILLVVVFGNIYGAAMGSFGGILGERLLQVFYSAVKAPAAVDGDIRAQPAQFLHSSTPCSACGRISGRRSARLVAGQAGMTILLAALAPFTLLWNVSFPPQNAAILFNA